MSNTTLPGVREKLTQIQDKAVADGRIPGDEASRAAITMPSFSKGTVPLDNNGAAIEERVPPAFETEHVDLPASTETTGVAPSSATPPAAAPAAASATPASAAAAPGQAAGVAEAPAAAATGAAAAESAAEAIAEKMAEFVFHDPDLDLDIPIQVPEKFAETAKRGYNRRTTYDKSISYLKNAEPILREMIEDGRIQRVMPFLQRAVSDPEFAQAVSDVYTRRVAGQPMLEAAVREIQDTPPTGLPGQELGLVDPFVDPQVAELRTQQAELLAWKRAQEEQQQRSQQTQQERNAVLRAHNERMAFAHRQLAQTYPGIFNPTLGERDPAFDRAYRYAQDSGYFQQYTDPAAAVQFGWYGVQQIDADRAAATQSPAASALAAVDTRLVEAASREARNSASTVAGGSVATTTLAAPPPKPSTKNPDGTLKAQDVYMGQVLDWERTYGRLKPA